MKKLLFNLLFISFSIALSAQAKVALTKGETINYIDTKLYEAVGHYNYKTISPQINKYYCYSAKFEREGVNVKCTESFSTYQSQPSTIRFWYYQQWRDAYPCNYVVNYYTRVFNPAHIKSIDLAPNPSNDPIGYIQITLTGNTGRLLINMETAVKKMDDPRSPAHGMCYSWEATDVKSETVQILKIPFLVADESNFNKLKKAFEHLRDLYKADDDPFGN